MLFRADDPNFAAFFLVVVPGGQAAHLGFARPLPYAHPSLVARGGYRGYRVFFGDSQSGHS